MSTDKEALPVDVASKPRESKSYLRLVIGRELQQRFKAKCSLEGTNMNTKAKELIEKWVETGEE